jgi:hypothetical protein
MNYGESNYVVSSSLLSFYLSNTFDDHHANGVRLRLWTAATNEIIIDLLY